MKKILPACLLLALIIGPSKYAIADTTGLQVNVETAPAAVSSDEKLPEEENAQTKAQHKIIISDKSAQAEEKPAEQKPEEEKPAQVKPKENETKEHEIRAREFPSRSRSYESHSQDILSRRHTSNESQKDPVNVVEPAPIHSRGAFRSHVREITRENSNPKQPEFTADVRRPVQPPAPSVVVIDQSHRSGFESTIRSPGKAVQTGTIVTITHPDDRSYRERELRERELRLREWELRERENKLRNREMRISEQERAFYDRDWYNRQLRLREWEDGQARDQELRYLLWRENQLSKYFWRDKGRICRYVTTYKTGFRINKHVTLCERRHGVYKCYHPKRYFIYPVTKLVCYQPNDRRLIGIIIRPYPY